MTAAHEAFDRYYGLTDSVEGAFIDGARWFAAGMAVCAFLEDLSLAVTNGCIACGDRVFRDADLCAPCRERGCCSTCGSLECYP